MVVFTVRAAVLEVLLVERAAPPYRGHWALPGGFVDIDEALDAAAARELSEETGLDALALEQIHTFGAPERDPRERVISVAYLGLVAPARAGPRAGSDAAAAGWFARRRLPALAFDHAEIIDRGHRLLAARLQDPGTALQLLPEQFTLSELQRVYEAVLERPLDKRNFRKRVLARDDIEATGSWRRAGQHRPARLYRAGRGCAAVRRRRARD